MADCRLLTTNAIATTVIMAMPVVRIGVESRHVASRGRETGAMPRPAQPLRRAWKDSACRWVRSRKPQHGLGKQRNARSVLWGRPRDGPRVSSPEQRSVDHTPSVIRPKKRQNSFSPAQFRPFLTWLPVFHRPSCRACFLQIKIVCQQIRGHSARVLPRPGGPPRARRSVG
jgi:hypothetical protein